jgi:DNA-binding transcriptional LysR family regulator
MNATLRQLEAFASAYRLGSLTRAAAEMHLSQPAISLLVRQLEDAWHIRLFDRTTRALNPTYAANAAFPAVARILGEVKSVAKHMQGLQEGGIGRVSFAVTAGVASALMPRVLFSFRTVYPDIKIQMLDVAGDQLTAKIFSGEAEFSIGTVENNDPEITLETLLQDRLSAIGLRDGSFETRRNISWDELIDLQTISVPTGTGIRKLIDDALGWKAKRFEPTLETSLLNTALAMTAQGLGISILPSYLVPFLQFPNLAAIPLVDPIVYRNLSLIRRAGRRLSPTSQTLVLALKDTIAKLSGTGLSHSADMRPSPLRRKRTNGKAGSKKGQR